MPKTSLSLKDEVGFGAVLDVSDPSPFWIFGDVPPGQSLYAISNNMFRAVLVRHEPIRNDFICLRYSHKGRVHYYLREMPAIITAGQIFPAVEIFSPYSRKYLHFGRNRIKVAAYRLFHKDPQGKRLKITRIVSAFPQFSEGSIRKWLKEYSESRRKGPESSGMWYLKNDAPSLSEDDLRSLVSPEMACIYEAMLVGQQQLIDLGYQGIFEEDHEEDETSASLQLTPGDPRLSQAPWYLSSNVLSAVEGKSLLQVNESGRGAQIFSFVQEKPEKGKGARPRTGEQLIQQKNKLGQVWRNMLLALLNRTQNPLKPIFAEESSNLEDETGYSQHSASTSSNKRLVITRIRIDEQSGSKIQLSETVTDPRVIAQYLRVKQEQSSKKKKRRQLQIVSKPPARKKPKAVSEVSKPPKPPKELPNVRCGACGAFGHMRTNRICPMFNIPEAHYVPSPTETHAIDPNAPVKIEGGKLTITIDSLKRAAEDRAKSLTFKLPSRVLSNASSGTSTPLSSSESSSVTSTKKRPPVIKKKKLAPWQRLSEEFPQLRED